MAFKLIIVAALVAYVHAGFDGEAPGAIPAAGPVISAYSSPIISSPLVSAGIAPPVPIVQSGPLLSSPLSPYGISPLGVSPILGRSAIPLSYAPSAPLIPSPLIGRSIVGPAPWVSEPNIISNPIVSTYGAGAPVVSAAPLGIGW